MILLIQGKHIRLDVDVELITENPIINNFEKQNMAYSNTVELEYAGDIVSVLDVSELRKSNNPYFLLDAHLIDEPIFIPVQVIVISYSPISNKVKIGLVEKIKNQFIRNTKLTELRHQLFKSGAPVPGVFVDEVMLDKTTLEHSLFAESQVVNGVQNYPSPTFPNNSCILISISDFIVFLEERYGQIIENCPLGNFFANQQKSNPRDVIVGLVDAFGISSNDMTFVPSLIKWPAGVDEDAFLTFGDELKRVVITNVIGDSNNRFLTCTIATPSPDPSDWKVYLKDIELDLISASGIGMRFGISSLSAARTVFAGKQDSGERVIDFRVTKIGTPATYDFQVNFRLELTIQDNREIATENNTRQVFQNMPEITVIDFFKEIAKANAKYIEITDNGLKFIDIAQALSFESILDISNRFIEAVDVQYKLYDAPSLQYWYAGATTPTLEVLISDERVKGDPRKIELGILRTADENVVLFEADGVRPLSGLATYPFFDISQKVGELISFYESIQKPYIVRAKFRKFNVNLSSALLVRQLNGIFIPKKIITTNRDIIELELLKIES